MHPCLYVNLVGDVDAVTHQNLIARFNMFGSSCMWCFDYGGSKNRPRLSEKGGAWTTRSAQTAFGFYISKSRKVLM